MRKINFFLLAFLWLLQYQAFSQAPSFEAGLKISKEFSNGKNDGAGFGLQSVYTFTKNISIEAGISYKTNPVKQLVFQNTGPNTRPFYEPFSKTEKTILIPVAFRFYTGFVTLSAGSGLHLLLNKKDFAAIDIPEKTDWKNNTMEILASLGLSKSLRVNKTLYVEPEIKYCNYSNGGGSGFQLNLAMRKRLF